MTYLPSNSGNYKLHDTRTMLWDNNQAIKAFLQNYKSIISNQTLAKAI